MTVIRELFLDLEDTVITPVVNGWHNCEFINRARIGEFIEEFRPDRVSLFSFALHNQRELELFVRGLRPDLEQWLGHSLSLTPTVDDDIIPACCREMGLSPATVDFTEALAFWNKQQGFKLWLRDTVKRRWQDSNTETQVLLLDDVVYNEDFRWPDIYVQGSIRNIDHPVA